MSTEHDLMPKDVSGALARSAEPLTDEARARIRHAVMSSIRRDSRAHYFATISHRVAASIAAIGVLGTGVAYAAENALPGDALYKVKRATEDALVAILPPGALENGVLLGVAERRAGEAASLARNGAAEGLISDAIDEVRAAVQQAESVAGPLTGEETSRIQEQAQDAPAQTREAISNAVNAPATTPAGGTGSDAGTGTGTSPGSGSDTAPGSPTGPGDTGGSTRGESGSGANGAYGGTGSGGAAH